MDNKTYQNKYRRTKEDNGWRYFSVMIPPECYAELKKFYLKWKGDNLHLWDMPKKNDN